MCARADETGSRWLTARYRLRAGPVFGNLLAAFAADIQRIRRGAVDDVRGAFLPPIGPDVRESAWSTLLAAEGWDRLDELADMPGLAGGGALGPEWLRVFSGALRERSALPSDRRLLLLCDVDRDHGPAPEWHAAIEILLSEAELPENVVLVLSDAPRDWQGDPHVPRTSEILVEPTGDADREEVYTFVEAALSGDQPAEVDRLGVARLADGLARLLLLPQTRPLTVGLQAPWGRGKSSFLAFVREALIRRAPSNAGSAEVAELEGIDAELLELERSDKPEAQIAAEVRDQRKRRQDLLKDLEHRARTEVITISFNAWRYEGAQQVWAGLARTITTALESALSRPERLRARIAYAIRRRELEFWGGFAVPVALAVVVAVIAVILGVADAGEELSGFKGWLEALVPVGAVLLIAWRAYQVLQPVSARVAGYVQGPDYAARMGYQNEVIDDLQFLHEQLPGDTRAGLPRVVVSVDDLDRCSDESIMETLQAINLVLGASDFFIILAIDPDMIHRAIARQRGLSDDDELAQVFAENYLRKIIQLPLHLHGPTADQRFGFVRGLFTPAAQREFLAARAHSNGAAPQAGGAPREAEADRTPFSWRPAAVVSPRVQVHREVQDTKEELDALEAFQDFLQDNPRELKRLVNVHRLVKILLLRPDAPPTKEQQRKLVAWLVFCARWPALVDDVLACAANNPREDDCVATVQAAQQDAALKRFAERLGGDRLSARDLAAEGTLAAAARIALLVRDEPAPRT
jgi:hypothetical protein